MQYEMKNFVKITKKNKANQLPKKDDWKRERKLARKTKQQMQRKVA